MNSGFLIYTELSPLTLPKAADIIFQTKLTMSQNYFDKYVNRIGEAAVKVAVVVNSNKVLREEIANWVE